MMDWFTGIMEEQGLQVVLESASPDPSLDEHIYYPPICHNTFGGNGFEYNPDGPNYGMYAHMSALVAHYTDLGGEIAYETPAQQLVQDADGRVTGVIAENAEGQHVQYNAAKGVILCTGGYAGNADMVHELCPETYFCAGTSTSGDTGDGIRMAMWAGAELEANHACMIWNRIILPDDFEFGLDPTGTLKQCDSLEELADAMGFDDEAARVGADPAEAEGLHGREASLGPSMRTSPS